jgi:hypothetical protein
MKIVEADQEALRDAKAMRELLKESHSVWNEEEGD